MATFSEWRGKSGGASKFQTKGRRRKMVRIQLSSNFQVVELTFDSLKDGEFDAEELNRAIGIVNDLGKRVVNDIKTAPKTQESKKEEERATPGQIRFLRDKFGIDASGMSKKEAWTKLQQLTKSIED